MQITNGKVVLFDYTLTDADQALVESSSESGPLAFIQGAGQIVPGLETAMDGRNAGDSFSIVVQPEEGYGLIDAGKRFVISRAQIEGVDELEVGTILHGEDGSGNEADMLVTKIDGDEVTIDGNHPLAGEELHFEIHIRGVRDATVEELQHGHAHGEGGAAH